MKKSKYTFSAPLRRRIRRFFNLRFFSAITYNKFKSVRMGVLSVIFALVLISTQLMLPVSASVVYLLGDADFNGKIDSADARLALRFAVGLDKLTKSSTLVTDVDADGKITSADARIILRCCVGLHDLGGAQVTIDSTNDDDFIFIGPDENGDEYENFIGGSDVFERIVPPAPTINAPSGTFTFTVYGYGHGVGLSQYGAVALAEHGWLYADILAYYYTGCSVVFGDIYPENTSYAGEIINTKELIARIVTQEIGGITNNPNALKAQALCVYTLLKRCDFKVNYRYDVGYAASSYNKCSEAVKTAVEECIGQYIVRTSDRENAPIESVYSAMSAGASAASVSVWGGVCSYLSSVNSPFEMRLSNFISSVNISSEDVRKLIADYDSAITLSENPSEWLEIVSHTASVDESRGYVTSIRVGSRVLNGYSQFLSGLLCGRLRSSCFTVTYTP